MGLFFNLFPGALLDTLLTILWIVGLTNALNLLDDMDGLAGGIGLIAALFLAFFFYQQGDLPGALVALSLAEHGIWVRQLRLEFTEETD